MSVSMSGCLNQSRSENLQGRISVKFSRAPPSHPRAARRCSRSAGASATNNSICPPQTQLLSLQHKRGEIISSISREIDFISVLCL